MASLPAGAPCWCQAPEGDQEAYLNATFVQQQGAKLVVEVGGAQREIDPSHLREANPGPSVPDLTTMVVLNEATMLNNVRDRFQRDRIYTRASNMLVAVNPGHPLPELYSEAARGRTKSGDLRDVSREPHLYDVAEQAYRQLVAEKKPQSIIISGESGAGKTESIKYCMNFLVWRAPADEKGTGAGGGELTKRIMQSNPLLESLGNAKTQRNNNSSRFGKYITLQFASTSAIVGAQIHTFLLEKSRVTSADAPNERSYHVLYQLVAGSPLAKGTDCSTFRMLSQSGTTSIPGRNDKDEFSQLQLALGWFGIEPNVQAGLWEAPRGSLPRQHRVCGRRRRAR